MCWRSFKARLLTASTQNNDIFCHSQSNGFVGEKPSLWRCINKLCKCWPPSKAGFVKQYISNFIPPFLLQLSFWRAGGWEHPIRAHRVRNPFQTPKCSESSVFWRVLFMPVVGFVLTSFFLGGFFPSRLFEPRRWRAAQTGRLRQDFHWSFLLKDAWGWHLGLH